MAGSGTGAGCVPRDKPVDAEHHVVIILVAAAEQIFKAKVHFAVVVVRQHVIDAVGVQGTIAVEGLPALVGGDEVNAEFREPSCVFHVRQIDRDLVWYLIGTREQLQGFVAAE